MSSEENGAGVSPETFQEIIRQRKAEKRERAEERRRDALKRIQEMKSKEGVDPLEIFPKEIWQLILDELHPEDRGKMWHLHDVFRDLMKNSHIQKNLFPQVLKFKVAHVLRYNIGLESYRILRKLPLFHHNLQLRQVSKTIRNEIDRNIGREILQSIRGGTWRIKFHKPMRFVLLSQSKNCIEKLDRLLAATGTGPVVPRLIYRSISISLHEGEFREGMNEIDDESFQQLFEEFRKKMSRFLERVGNQIWHLKFHATPFNAELACNVGISERYLALVEWLSKMPNLKWIQINHCCNGQSSKCLDSFHVLSRLALPKLDRLERVDLEVYTLHPKCQKETRILSKMILQTNPTVKILNIAQGGWLDLTCSVELPQLEAINFFQGILLKTLNWMTWPLKRMALRLYLENGPINPLFQFLQKFPTLQQVSLKVCNVTIGEEDIDFLMLPRLTELNLVITPKVIYGPSFRFFFSLQFLLHCKSLRRLDWTIESDCVENLKRSNMQGNLLDFAGGWGDRELTKDSNVWQVFPDLKYVMTHIKDFVLDSSRQKYYHKDKLL